MSQMQGTCKNAKRSKEQWSMHVAIFKHGKT